MANQESSIPAGLPTANRHALTPVAKQKNQLEKLLRDPSKPAYIPPAPKEKVIRPPREMMKNVQGSSAGAGSGEFHVYKASRRREYERLKLLEEESQKETTIAEFERKRRQAEEVSEAKTAKNRAKRQKKKQRSKTKGGLLDSPSEAQSHDNVDSQSTAPVKKRRLVNGKELVFRHHGEDSDEDEEEELKESNQLSTTLEVPPGNTDTHDQIVPAVELPKITIHED